LIATDENASKCYNKIVQLFQIKIQAKNDLITYVEGGQDFRPYGSIPVGPEPSSLPSLDLDTGLASPIVRFGLQEP
jgi:hypothetical protein